MAGIGSSVVQVDAIHTQKNNPSLDETGESCSIDQNDKNEWLLTGTFENIVPVRRKCIIPEGRTILFPIVEKEDSIAEDQIRI